MTTIAFALRTTDEAWIKRNHGTVGEAGRVFVQVPAAEVVRTTHCGHLMLRHVFADCPEDCANAAIVCPASWVPGSVAKVTRDAPDPRIAARQWLASAGR